MFKNCVPIVFILLSKKMLVRECCSTLTDGRLKIKINLLLHNREQIKLLYCGQTPQYLFSLAPKIVIIPTQIVEISGINVTRSIDAAGNLIDVVRSV